MKENKYFLLLWIIFITSCDSAGCNRKQVWDLSINGNIVEKYADSKNHGMYTLIIQEKYRKYKFVCGDYADLWGKAKVGDSIVKNNHSYVITIFKENGEKREYKYNYDY